MTTLSLFPNRVAIGQFTLMVDGRPRQFKVQMTPEFYRALQTTLTRLGGTTSNATDADEVFLESTMASMLMAPEDGADIAVMQDQPGVDDDGGAHTAQVFQRPDDEPCLPAFLVQPVGAFSPLPFRSIDVSASPMTIVADRRCAVHVEGAVDALAYERAGSSLDVSGQTLIEMNLGDTLTVTYTSAPTLTLIER